MWASLNAAIRVIHASAFALVDDVADGRQGCLQIAPHPPAASGVFVGYRRNPFRLILRPHAIRELGKPISKVSRGARMEAAVDAGRACCGTKA